MEDLRKRVNREVILLVMFMGGSFIKYIQFDSKDLILFYDDGVYLFKKGNDLFLENIEKVVILLFKVEGEENE